MATWADFIASGTGRIEFRLVIEGCKYEFCTSALMYGTLTGTDLGKSRIGGLLREGLSIEEKAYIAGADLDIRLGTAKIIDTLNGNGGSVDLATEVFSSHPVTRAFVTSYVAPGDTTINVSDNGAVSVGDYLHLATEVVRVTNKPTSTTLTVARGYWRTTAQAHPVQVGALAAVRTLIPQLRSSPATLRNRRIWVYAHGDTELTTSDAGTCIWRGVVADDPSLDSDGVTWNVSLESRLSLFDTDIGTGSSENGLKVRGIHYNSYAPLLISAFVCPTSTRDLRAAVAALTVYRIWVVGFWETQEAFCSYLVTQMQASVPGVAWSARTSPTGQWELYYTTPSAGQVYIALQNGSWVDGSFDGYVDEQSTRYNPYSTVTSTVNASTTYRCTWSNAPNYVYGVSPVEIPDECLRQVPRAVYSLQLTRSAMFSSMEPTLSVPNGTLYVDTVAGISTGDGVVVGGDDDSAYQYVVNGVGTSDGSVDLTDSPALEDHTLIVCGTSAPDITIAKRFDTPGTGITVADFIWSVVNSATLQANYGTQPLLTSDDIDALLTLQTEVNAAASGAAYLTGRQYAFSKPVKLLEVLKHELRLYGMYIATNSGGQVTFKRILLDTDAPTYILNNVVVNDGFGEVDYTPDGIINEIVLKTGYTAAEDKHTGDTITIRADDGIASLHKKSSLEVAPKSRAVGSEPTPADAWTRIGQPVLALYGQRQIEVTVSVPWTFFNASIGTPVLVTIPQLPFDGARGRSVAGTGLSAKIGKVVGRSFSAEGASGKLHLLFSNIDAAGYCPCARVASAAGAGVSWAITMTSNKYAQTGAVDASYFVTGSRVRIYQWDSATPTSIVGTVTGVAGSVVSVTFDSAWAGVGASTWNLQFAPSNTASITSAQRNYTFVAATSGRVTLASGSDPAKILSP